MVALAKLFDWRDALLIVKPETFVRWHRAAFKMFWRRRSRKRGRPALPTDIRELVRQIARENPTWGQERIPNRLSLQLSLSLAANRRQVSGARPAAGSSGPTLVNFRSESC